TETEAKSLVSGNFSEQTLSLKVRIEMDIWLNFLIEEAKREPVKLLAKARHHSKDEQANTALKSLVGYVMQYYLQQQRVEFVGQNVLAFDSNFADSLVEFLEDYVARQKQLGSA